MIKCTFVLGSNKKDVKIHTELKTQEEIDSMLIENKYFSIKIVDEYYLIDRRISRAEHDNILMPYLLKKENEHFKKEN